MRRTRLLLALGLSLAAAPVAAGPARAADDPYLSRQWGLAKIGAPAAWTLGRGAGVTIGVVDTGVDLGHEDLAGHLLGNTRCVGTGGAPSKCQGSGADIDGHGTHVAGIAAAIGDNGKGGAGAAPDARLLAAAVFTKDSSGNPTASVNDINAGVEWVVDHGAKVVNLSLGENNTVVADVLGSSLGTGIEYAYSHGAIAVIAAGNAANTLLGSTDYGNLDALVVTATNQQDNRAGYASQVGSAKWGLAAPGGDVSANGKADCNGSPAGGCILSTYTQNRYAWLEGTSMATPFVSGAAAALMSHGLSRDQVVNRILSTLAPASCGSGCKGRLDLAKAMGASAGPGGGTTGGGSGSGGGGGSGSSGKQGSSGASQASGSSSGGAGSGSGSSSASGSSTGPSPTGSSGGTPRSATPKIALDVGGDKLRPAGEGHGPTVGGFVLSVVALGGLIGVGYVTRLTWQRARASRAG
ncbi:MAG: hypothetical protein QOG03_2129 [Actinomycetota bacterium]|nr:hypothetical protein [Actinomycetota bacterium]